MKNINSIPTLLILKNILQTLKDSSSRFISISYSHTFHSNIINELQHLELQYKTVDFLNMVNPDSDTKPPKSNIIKTIFVKIFQFLTELIPVVALIDFFSGMALEVAGYYLKKSDITLLKKYLGIKRKPQKYKKLKQIIIVKELSELTEENIKYLNFLGSLIKKGYLPKTALLVFCDKNFDSGYIFANSDHYELTFTAKDYEKYTGEQLNNIHLLGVIEELDLEYIDTLQELLKSNHQLNSAKHIIKSLIEKNGYDTEALSKFLIICSYLFDEFKLFDIEELNKKIETDYKNMLPASLDSKILRTPRLHTYSFTEKKFKEYFLNMPPISISHEDAIYIMNYLEKEYPDRYADLALASKFMPLENSRKLSYFIIAFYHQKTQSIRYNDIIVDFLSLFPLGKEIIQLNTARGNIYDYAIEELLYEVKKGIELMNSDAILTPEAKLCALNYISDVAYEIINEYEILYSIFENYLQLFQELHIFSDPQEKFVDYVLDAIIFSTSMEKYSVQKKVDKLVYWVEKRKFKNIENKIKFYRLGNLLYSLDREKALEFTHIAYDISSDNIILKEKARLNYSVSLMGVGQFKKAYDILIRSKNYFSDYKIAFANNLIIAGFLCGNYSSEKTVNKFKELEESVDLSITSDHCIVINNYISALIVNESLTQTAWIEQAIQKIIAHQDNYHTFFALHNLLILYYLNQDFENFKAILPQIQVPYLLRYNRPLVEDKLKFLEQHFDNHYTYNELEKNLNILNNSQYGVKMFISPVIWGMMERWFK